MTKTKKIINPGRDGELEQIPLKTDVAERVERGDLRQGSMQLQELADEVRGHELPIDHQAKAYDRTQLKVKQEKDEKQIYAEIERETGEIQKAFEAEIDELIDKKKSVIINSASSSSMQNYSCVDWKRTTVYIFFSLSLPLALGGKWVGIQSRSIV